MQCTEFLNNPVQCEVEKISYRVFCTISLLFTAVSDMLGDAHLEVRSCASATLAGMIRCSARRVRDPMIVHLKSRFEEQLKRNPMPKRGRRLPGTGASVDMDKQIIKRHAAVLGLGALIEAFPYATPPPEWMRGVLATLAHGAVADPGVVGNATKKILSEFKKTRQDTWTIDKKVCCMQSEPLAEGASRRGRGLIDSCSISPPNNWTTWEECWG